MGGKSTSTTQANSSAFQVQTLGANANRARLAFAGNMTPLRNPASAQKYTTLVKPAPQMRRAVAPVMSSMNDQVDTSASATAGASTQTAKNESQKRCYSSSSKCIPKPKFIGMNPLDPELPEKIKDWQAEVKDWIEWKKENGTYIQFDTDIKVFEKGEQMTPFEYLSGIKQQCKDKAYERR